MARKLIRHITRGLEKITTIIVVFGLVFGNLSFALPKIADAAVTATIRQEINIIDGYLGAVASAYATSSAIVYIDQAKYSGSETYYFEVVASTTSSIASNVYLKDTTGVTYATAVIPIGTTNPTLIRSSSFSPSTSAKEYVAVIGNEAGATKSIKSARVVVVQTMAGTSNSSATSTQTQIEIGNEETFTTTATTTFSNPKYWTYSSSAWDTTFSAYAEVTYKVINGVASSTAYNTSGTYTVILPSGTASTSVELTGGGGAGGGASSNGVGGDGGAGGQYAKKSLVATTSSHTLVVAATKAGTSGVGTAGNDSTWDTGVAVAKGGSGGGSSSASTTGSTTGCVGDVCFAGGSAGKGVTTYGAGGGGGAGASGAGNSATGAGVAGAATTAGGGGGGTKVTANGQTAGFAAGGGGSGAFKSNGAAQSGGAGAQGRATTTSYIATTTIALQEDDGAFGSWTDKVYINTASSIGGGQETRLRSAAFIPVDGRHYRIALRKNDSRTSVAIYNAKIIVNQSSVIEEFLDGSANNSPGTLTSVNTEVRQSFTGVSGTLKRARFYLQRNGTGVGTLSAKLYAHTGTYGVTSAATGGVLATSDNTIDVSTIAAGSYELKDFTFSGYTMTPGTYYVIALTTTGADASGAIVGINNSDGSRATGNYSTISGTGDTYDLLFGVYTDAEFSKFESQYLLANTKLSPGTGLQNFLTKWDSSEWSGVTNTYLHAVDSANSSASVVELDTAAGTQLTGSSKSSPSNYSTSTSVTMPSNGNLDLKATTNNNDIYSSRILVQTAFTASPALALSHYRWRVDDGTEAAASSLSAEDTAVSTNVIPGDRIRLRMLLANSGGAATGYTYKLEVASSSCTSWFAVPSYGANINEHWAMDYSPYVPNGQVTTNLAALTDPGGYAFSSGYLQTSSNQTASLDLAQNGFTELEYAIKSTSNARVGTTYCFRVTNAGSATGFTYTTQPQIVLSASANRTNGGGVQPVESSGSGTLRTGGTPNNGGNGGGSGSESSGGGTPRDGGGQGGGGGDLGILSRFNLASIGVFGENMITTLLLPIKALVSLFAR